MNLRDIWPTLGMKPGKADEHAKKPSHTKRGPGRYAAPSQAKKGTK